MHIARWCVIWTQIQNRPEQTLDFRETSLYENLLKSTSDVSFCTSSVFGLTPYFVLENLHLDPYWSCCCHNACNPLEALSLEISKHRYIWGEFCENQSDDNISPVH